MVTYLRATITCLSPLVTSGLWSPRGHGHLPQGPWSSHGHGHLTATATHLRAFSHFRTFSHLTAMATSWPRPLTSGLQSPTSGPLISSGPWSAQGHGLLRAMVICLRTTVTSASSPLTLGPWSPRGHDHLPEGMVTSRPVSDLRATITSGLLVIIKRTTMFLWSPQGHSHHGPSPKRTCVSDSSLALQPLAVCFGGQPHGLLCGGFWFPMEGSPLG